MPLAPAQSLAERYRQEIKARNYEHDARQAELIDSLAECGADILAAQNNAPGPLRRLFGARRRTPEGRYFWGGVGRGKTFLMDLFFDWLPIKGKRRIHFHRFMQFVHQGLARHQGASDPLELIADEFADEYRVLCFDEFFVSDIGDAMLMAGLLKGLFARGVCLLATSNVPPDELYKDGLQRQKFLPAIALLKQHCRVEPVAGEVDYRLRLLEQAEVYLDRARDDHLARMRDLFRDLAGPVREHDKTIEINARRIPLRSRGEHGAWFDFDQLCETPRSAADFVELARLFPTVFLSEVPAMDDQDANAVRRFINLIDEFYDRHVRLVIAADVAINQLYQGERLAFEFERTESRLIEMQTSDYLALEHLA